MSVVTKFLLTILIFMQLSETPLAEQRHQCVPSSCGHIHNISYPFRLKSDPKHCGLKNYELSCEGDRAILPIPPHDWDGSLNYYVQAINYDNSTIRLVDPVPITLFSCPFSINSPVFVEITNCLNRSYASNVSSDSFKGHTYATMAELSPSDLKSGVV
ncbi:hypothetical protein KY290_003706 [Solanum tuberosum]|uniref:Wall-associated receptor kinase galacturonan-binding domain-containing protein n=1 Tax=Solanum tuberosum TaxID=4113 RepID=A0ABQ7WVP2_SOLTU|nr:hypothetical protein KY290_003706 [Solanum tuberosum]